MELFKQICSIFAEKRIHYSDSLEAHFDIIHEVLWTHCLAFGQRFPCLEEEELQDLYRETSEFLVQRFQKQDIDIKEIHIENSEAVIQKFVSAFIFIFQQRMVEKIKQQNQYIDLLLELLEEFEKQGSEELDMQEMDKFRQEIPALLEKQKLSQAQELIMAFFFSRFNTWLLKYKDLLAAGGKTGESLIPNRLSQVKLLLQEKRIINRKALQEILLNI